MNKGEEIVSVYWDLFNKKNWLDEYQMKSSLQGYHPSDLHCIAYIHAHTDRNVTSLSEAFYMTRSAVSKLTRRLIKKGLIESYQKTDNKKEIYFRLTTAGEELNKIHEAIHEEMSKRDEAVLDHISEEEYTCLMKFAHRYQAHLDQKITALGVDMKQEDYDTL